MLIYVNFLIIKTIDVQEKAGSIKIVTRKVKASPHAVGSAYSTTSVRARSGGRRALGIASAAAKRSYRPDLRTVSVYFIPHRHSYFRSFFVLSLFLRIHQDALSLEPSGTAEKLLKEGRGHVCNINPAHCSDQLQWVSRHVAIGHRLMLYAACTDSLAITSNFFPFITLVIFVVSLPPCFLWLGNVTDARILS